MGRGDWARAVAGRVAARERERRGLNRRQEAGNRPRATGDERVDCELPAACCLPPVSCSGLADANRFPITALARITASRSPRSWARARVLELGGAPPFPPTSSGPGCPRR